MELTRRKFLGGLGALIGGVALEEAIPFNRVWSFPSKIVIPNIGPLATIYYNRQALAVLKQNLVISSGKSLYYISNTS